MILLNLMLSKTKGAFQVPYLRHEEWEPPTAAAWQLWGKA